MYIGHLFNSLVVNIVLFVSVKSEVIILIIFPLIIEADQVDIEFLVSSSNRSLIPLNGL